MNVRRFLGSRPDSATANRRSNGQALVEFALVAPLLFLLLIGIFEAGRYVLYSESLNNAAREGARYAIVHGARGAPQVGPLPDDVSPRAGHDPTGITVGETIGDAALGLLDPARLTIPQPCWQTRQDRDIPASPALCPADGNNGRGSPVTIWVDYDYDTIIGTLFGLDLLPTINISAESTYVINN